MDQQLRDEVVRLLKLWLERLDFSDPYFDKPKVEQLLRKLEAPKT